MNKSTETQATQCMVSTLNQDMHTQLPEEILALNFERLKYKATSIGDAEMSVEEWDASELEYRRFLTLKLLYPGLSLIPGKQVAKLWHTHILDTRAYREDCGKVFGRFIDHYPYFGIYGKADYRELQIRIAQTVALYERHFGPHPETSHAVDSQWHYDVCQEVKS